MKKNEIHESVMTREVVENLHIKTGSRYIDATLGTGGHSLAIMDEGGEVLGIEADPEMIEIARERIPNGNFVLGNFSDIDKIANKAGFSEVSGIVFDLGVTNLHLTGMNRGFSFSNPGAPLDMRLNPNVQGVKASDLLNALRRDQLKKLFSETLERGPANWITERVLEFRERQPFEKVEDMLIVSKGLRVRQGRINEATLPFLALRIAVNSELDNLSTALPKAFNLLEIGGTLIVITFHSGEDRIVKEFMKGKEKIVNVAGTEAETNPRSRSARMRILIKK